MQAALDHSLDVPQNLLTLRDCKGWLTTRRTDGHPYRPTADQAALASIFDMDLCRSNSASFRKLWRDVTRLLG